MTATCDDLWRDAAAIRKRHGVRRVTITIETAPDTTLSVEDTAPGVPSAAPKLPGERATEGCPWAR